MNLTEYETRIRKQIKKLKNKKKEPESNKIEIEQEIKSLKSKLINNTDNAVFSYLAANVNYDNLVDLNKIKKTQTAIAEELCLERTMVSRAFKKLKRLNVIDYKVNGYAFDKITISPYILWRGDADKHRQMIARMQEDFSKLPFEA